MSISLCACAYEYACVRICESVSDEWVRGSVHQYVSAWGICVGLWVSIVCLCVCTDVLEKPGCMDGGQDWNGEAGPGATLLPVTSAVQPRGHGQVWEAAGILSVLFWVVFGSVRSAPNVHVMSKVFTFVVCTLDLTVLLQTSTFVWELYKALRFKICFRWSPFK